MSKPEGFVEATFKGIPFYIRLEDADIVHKNWFYGCIFEVLLWFNLRFSSSEYVDFDIVCKDEDDMKTCSEWIEQCEHVQREELTENK